jgi:hypothetical protein
VHAADAVIDDAGTGIGEPIRRTPDDLGTEAVVAEEDVADAGYQNA